MRNPTAKLSPGPKLWVAQIAFLTSEAKPPPFRTCTAPDLGGVGSGNILPLYGSATHSQTLPSMSYRPHAFGAFVPTSFVIPVRAVYCAGVSGGTGSTGAAAGGAAPRFPPPLPGRPKPSTAWLRMSVQVCWPGPPARHAYSHSNSLGRRYVVVFSFAFSALTKACVSCQVTPSTGCFSGLVTLSPWNSDGLVPITVFHCACVTSVLPMKYGFLRVTG